jgi:hypothetical protein
MPLAARRHTRAGARAFAVFFIETIDWAYATTSTTYMRRYFVPTCIACVSTAAAVDRARRLGRHFIGDRFTIRGARSLPLASPVGAVVAFDTESVEVVDSRGRYVDALEALALQERVYLHWSADGWSVKKMIPSVR